MSNEIQTSGKLPSARVTDASVPRASRMINPPGAVSILIDAYLNGAESACLAIAGMDRDQLHARPIAGAWSTLEVICHLADSEAMFADRMKRVLAEDRPPMPFADPTLYAAALA